MVSLVTRSTIIRQLRLVTILGSFAALACVGMDAAAQKGTTSYAPAHPINGPEPELPQTVAPLIAPLFLETDQLDSQVTVVNALLQASGGTLTIRDLKGNTAATKHIAYAPHSSTVVSIAQVLADAGSTVHVGSIVLEQDPAIKGPALLAQLSVTMHTGSQPTFLEEEFGMPGTSRSATLQGVANETENPPLVAITSNAAATQTIQASCVGARGTGKTSIKLASGTTTLLRACEWEQINDTGANLTSAFAHGNSTSKQAAGITITSDGAAGSFSAFGVALNGSGARAQLEPLNFSDPSTLRSTDIVYLGVPVGGNHLVEPGTYISVVTLANFTGETRNTTVSYADSSAESIPSTGVVPQVIKQVTLAPSSTQTLALTGLTGSGLQHSFTIQSDGKPGDVQAHLFAHREDSDEHVEMLAKDAQDDHNGGDHPWSIADGNTSTLLLFNPTKTQQEFQVRVSGHGATWTELFYLAPSETKAVSINDLIAKQMPDHYKKVLPRTITDGEVQWSTRTSASGLGRMLVSNGNTGLARNFSCPYYNELCAAQFGPESNQNLFLNQQQDFYSVQPIFCTEMSPSSCAQATPVGYGPAISTNYLYANSAQTQMVSSSNYDVTLKGIGLGRFGFTANVIAGSCSANVGGGGLVEPAPAYFFSPDATQVSTPAACGSNQGVFLDVQYYVADTTGARISQAGLIPGEYVNGEWTDGFSTPTSTRSDGSFDDVPKGSCYGTSGHFCEAGSPQSFRITQGKVPTDINTNTTSTNCTDAVQLKIMGNSPATQNKTYTIGTVP